MILTSPSLLSVVIFPAKVAFPVMVTLLISLLLPIPPVPTVMPPVLVRATVSLEVPRIPATVIAPLPEEIDRLVPLATSIFPPTN